MTERAPLSVDVILQLGIDYEAGKTLWDLAHQIHVKTTGPVERLLDKADVKRRPRGRKTIELPNFDEIQIQFDQGLISVAQVAVHYRQMDIYHRREFYRRRLKGLDSSGKKKKSE